MGRSSSNTVTRDIAVNAVNDAPTYIVGDGKLTTAVGAGHDNGRSVTVQADGKILVAGYSDNGSATTSPWCATTAMARWIPVSRATASSPPPS